MEKKWTEAQQSVIDTENKNILVSAAAGAGKTAVLVARIIKMITDRQNPIDIDKLVVITFTRAAAAQMKQKISDELEKLIEAEPENPLYRRQYRLLGNSAISTIDSFCLNIVRSYFQKLDLDPGFRIADETELKLIKSDTMDELMERYHEEGDEAFYYLLEAYCGYKSDETLTGYISNLSKKALAQAWPEKWLDSLLQNYEIKDAAEFNSSKIAGMVYEHVRNILQMISFRIDMAKNLCITDDGAPDYLSTIETEGLALKSALEAKDYDELGVVLRNIQFGRLSTKKSGVQEVKDKVKKIRDDYKKSIQDQIKKYYFSNTEDIVALLKKSYPAVRCLVTMAKDYLSLLSRKKKEKNVIDFSDAEHFALDILWGETPEALELRKRYQEIIIDEYQDSNNLQEYIARAIAGDCEEKPYIFTVGDVKQSIYAFRNACPELFVKKQKLYDEDQENGKLIILDNNFRSREEVLDSTNAVFKHIMRETLGGIEYNDKCSLKKGTDRQSSLGEDSPYKTEVLIVSKNLGEAMSNMDSGKDGGNEESSEKKDDPAMEDDNETSSANETKQVIEARLIANRIKELIHKDKLQVPDEDKEGAMRDVKYSDIVILLRTMKKWSSVFVETLESEGIPVFSEESDGFFKAQEVSLVIDLLRILDNPRQDIPFAAVLYSCIGGFTEGELAELRINGKDTENFYDAAFSIEQSIREKINLGQDKYEGSLPEYVLKLHRFFEIYNELERFKQTATVSELIDKIYDLTGLYNYYSAFPDGEKRRANLDMLPAYAISFENTSYSGLFGFIRYYEKLINKDLDYGEAGTASVGNCVRIMSIHKSKGLEFPVVFVAGMGKIFNFSDYTGDICVSSEGGIGIKYVDIEKRIKYPSFYQSVLNLQGKEDIIGEEMRLLYVAMTRAKDKLIMTGYADKPNTGTTYADLFASGSFMDFVYPVLDVEKKYFVTKIYSPDTVSKISEAGQSSGKAEDTVHNINSYEDNDKDALKKMILRARNAKYKYDSEEALPVKLSVSDLKHQQIEDEFGENVFKETRDFQPGDKTLPDFLKTEEKISKGTDYGTLMHKCMQFIPMSLRTQEDIIAFLETMEHTGKLTVDEYHTLVPTSVNRLAGFLSSPLAERIRKADSEKQFYREKQFMILINASDIDSEKYGNSEERIPVQGVIDAMFIEDGEIVILDYKTDRLSAGEEDRLVKLYKRQLDVYAEAAERLLGLPVKEKLLYSFSLGEEILVK